MHNLIGTEIHLRNTLKNLAALEYDTAAAYRSAAERVPPTSGNARLLELTRQHEDRARRLAPLIRAFGERPPRAGDWRQLVTQGRVIAGGVFNQRSVYQAVVDNERDVHDAYERALHRDDVAVELADFLRHYRDDAHRYHAELVQRLVQLD